MKLFVNVFRHLGESCICVIQNPEGWLFVIKAQERETLDVIEQIVPGIEDLRTQAGIDYWAAHEGDEPTFGSGSASQVFDIDESVVHELVELKRTMIQAKEPDPSLDNELFKLLTRSL